MGLFQTIKNWFVPKETTSVSTITPTTITGSSSTGGIITGTSSDIRSGGNVIPSRASSGGGGSSGGGSSGGGTTSTQEIPAQTKGVKVTDFTTGESVVTKTEGGKIKSQTYSPSPNKAGYQLGEERAIRTAGNVGEEKITTQEIPAQQVGLEPSAQGNFQQAPSSVSGFDYTGEPPQRYERPLGDALGESFRNVFNFGIIGQQGLKAYGNQIFIKPFEYVGKPLAYKKVGTNINPEWKGTEFGFGMSEAQKYNYTPEGFRDTTSQTWFSVGEQKKRAVYTKAGLLYTGEPVSVLPQRLGEDIAKDLKPEFQNRANAGENINVINQDYQRRISEVYSQRLSGVSGDISSVESFQSKIWEPPAYPIIRGAGRIIETGAVVGAVAFGGSGITFLASGYLGAKSVYQTGEYLSVVNELPMGQRIISGTGLALGYLGAFSVFNLGMNKFYNEFEGLIYSDLASQTARTTGKEVMRTDEFSRYNLVSYRETSNAKSVTFQRTDVYPTGADRVGFFSKGITMTQIENPRPYGSEFIYTKEAFKTSGYIPNIKSGVLSSVSGGLKVTPEDVFSGIGSAKIITSEKVRDVSFIAGSKDEEGYFRIVGADKLRQSTLTTEYFTASTNIKGSLSNVGMISKLQEEGTSRLIITSGAKSSKAFLNNMYGIGAGGAQELGTIQQQNVLTNLATAKVSSNVAPAVAGLSSFRIMTGTSEAYSLRTEQFEIQRMINSPAQEFRQSQSERFFSGNLAGFSLANATEQAPRFAFAPAQAFSQSQALNQRSALRNGLSFSPISNFPEFFSAPNLSSDMPIFIPSLDLGGDLGLSSNILKGGKRAVAYTPSFSALIFNLRGSYRTGKLSKSGIEFRPITKGFKFYGTGRNYLRF